MTQYYRNRYHSCRDIRFTPPVVPSGHVGIELEVESRLDLNFLDLLRLLPDIDRPRRPVVEEDGSLSSHRGMEIIFPPFSPRQLRHKSGAVSKVMDALRNSVVEDADHIGMHYNYSTLGWSETKKATFCAIIHNLPLGFLEVLAARNPQGYDSQNCGYSQAFYANNFRTFCGNKDNRIEVRFFGSTTDTKLLRLRLDFLAVVEAASESAAWDVLLQREFVKAHDSQYDTYYYRYESTPKSKAAGSAVAKSVFSTALASMKGKKWSALRRMWKENK